jgi:hypothetical protein
MEGLEDKAVPKAGVIEMASVPSIKKPFTEDNCLQCHYQHFEQNLLHQSPE